MPKDGFEPPTLRRTDQHVNQAATSATFKMCTYDYLNIVLRKLTSS